MRRKLRRLWLWLVSSLAGLAIAGCGSLFPPGPIQPVPDPISGDTATGIAEVLRSDRSARAALCYEIAKRVNEPEFDPKEHWNDGDKQISEKTNGVLRKLIKSRLDKGPDDAAWTEIGKGYGLR